MPRGDRRPDNEVLALVDQVETLMTEPYRTGEIVAICRQKWGMSARTAGDYMRRVLDRWKNEPDPEREAEVRALCRRWKRRSLELRAKGHHQAALGYEQLLARRHGVYSTNVNVTQSVEPIRLEVTIKGSEPKVG